MRKCSFPCIFPLGLCSGLMNSVGLAAWLPSRYQHGPFGASCPCEELLPSGLCLLQTSWLLLRLAALLCTLGQPCPVLTWATHLLYLWSGTTTTTNWCLFPSSCPSRGENSVHEAQGHLPIRKSCLQQCLWVEARKNCLWGLSCWLAVRAGPNS